MFIFLTGLDATRRVNWGLEMVRARHIYHRHTNALQQAPRFEVGEQVRCKYGGQWAIGRVVAHNYEEPQVTQNTVPCPFLAAMACYYVSLCRSLSPHSFPFTTWKPTDDPGV